MNQKTWLTFCKNTFSTIVESRELYGLLVSVWIKNSSVAKDGSAKAYYWHSNCLAQATLNPVLETVDTDSPYFPSLPQRVVMLSIEEQEQTDHWSLAKLLENCSSQLVTDWWLHIPIFETGAVAIREIGLEVEDSAMLGSPFVLLAPSDEEIWDERSGSSMFCFKLFC